MDREDMCSHLRVPSFSCYLDSAEERFVSKLTKASPLSSSPVVSPEESSCSNNLERNDKTKPEVCIFGAHISNKNEVFMRCCSIFACEGPCLEKQNLAVLQRDLRNSVEMLDSGTIEEVDIAVNLAKQFSRLTWDAIPSTGSRSIIPASCGSSSWCDDTASDNSSDLFDIESTKPDVLSKGQTFVGVSEKSLTVSDDEKVKFNCAGNTSSIYRTRKSKVSSWIKSGGCWLLGCRSVNAVRVAENTGRTSEDAES
ncbi:uncharacterized protein LOC141661420 isoform X2 [Apium graveolens]|uniref:uncharacterized protein LOC141661420 isoform X2 n=1 Tax=Apium graveolens TaxID=4045 RepID=UPI003D7B0794